MLDENIAPGKVPKKNTIKSKLYELSRVNLFFLTIKFTISKNKTSNKKKEIFLIKKEKEICSE